MNKTLLVAQREFVENLRTKTFWLGILSVPVLLVVCVFVAKLLAESKDVRKFTILDHSPDQWISKTVFKNEAAERLKDAMKLVESIDANDPIREALAEAERGDLPLHEIQLDSRYLALATKPEMKPVMEAAKIDLEFERLEFDDLGAEPENALNKKLESGEIFAYCVIGEDPVHADEGHDYVSNNVTDNDLRKWLERRVTTIVRAERIKELNLTQEQANQITKTFSFSEQQFNAETGKTEEVNKSDKAGKFAPVAFVYLLWIAIITATQMLLTNTVEEKSNRLIEVLLSSVSPIQLMAGKVIGIGATGLTMVAAWVASALIGVKFFPADGLGGIDLEAILGDPLYLSSFVAYFLAGYLLFSAFLVAIGSVCNSLKEAQSLQQPVFILLIVPLLAMLPVVEDPNGAIARILTYVPFFTPFLMMNRAGGPPPGWEYAATTILLLVSIVVAFWGAAKVFRLGILMTGKPPKIMEILRWLRAPVGQIADRGRADDQSTGSS